jgi:hypothetical protein
MRGMAIRRGMIAMISPMGIVLLGMLLWRAGQPIWLVLPIIVSAPFVGGFILRRQD